MDKSLKTNLHLWRFFARAKRTASCEANSPTYVQPLPPPPPPSTMLDTRTRYFSRGSTLYGGGRGGGGGATHLETENSAFLLNSVLNTQKINASAQMSKGILSTMMIAGACKHANAMQCNVM